MSYRYPLALIGVVFTILACGVPSRALAPTALPLPATPVFLPLPAATSPAAVPTSAQAAVSFAGTWKGPDPDDGSTMTLTLVQTGNSLEGGYSDSYSGNLAPPGFNGPVTGTVLSATTAQIALDVKRHDGAALLLQANLTLSSQGDALTVTITPSTASPWVLTRQ